MSIRWCTGDGIFTARLASSSLQHRAPPFEGSQWVHQPSLCANSSLRRRGQPECDLALARAALLGAKEQYPGLTVEQYLARLDQLAAEVKDRLAGETAPLVVLDDGEEG